MSSTIFYGPTNYANLEKLFPLAPRLHSFLHLNVQLIEHIGAKAALICAAFAERVQRNEYVCEHNKWWFSYSYPKLSRRTGLSIKQIRNTLDSLEEIGLVETARMDKKTGQRCYRLVPANFQDGELSVWTGYFKAQGIPKTEYVELKPVPYDEDVYWETGDFVLPTPKRRSIPGGGIRGGDALLDTPKGGRCPSGHPPIVAEMGATDTPEVLGVTSSTRGRGRGRAVNVFIHNKIGVKNDTDISDKLETEELPKNKQNKFTPTPREEQFTQYVLNKILENFPNISKDAQKKILQSGPKCVRQLSNKFGFKTVKEVLTWGLLDPFWKNQIRSLSPLLRPSKTHPEYKKFEMIKMSFEEQAKDPEDELMDEIKSLARTQSEDPKEVETIVDNVIWLQEEIENINENKVVKVRWTRSDAMLKVLKWLDYIESRIIENEHYETWDDIVEAYLEYLKRFVLTSPDRPLYAGYFDPIKPTFQNFAAWLEQKHGKEILDI